MRKWRVVKRDGVWVVLDHAGKLRYAAAEYRMALSFALMAGKRRKTAIDHRWPLSGAWTDILRWTWENKEFGQDGEQSQEGDQE